MARNDNSFEDALIEFDSLREVQPVDNTIYWTILTSLEKTGLDGVGNGSVKIHRLAEAMHGVFSRIADVQIEPPLSEEQTTTVAAKVETYAKMNEQTQPKAKAPRRTKKTDASKIPTDQSKR